MEFGPGHRRRAALAAALLVAAAAAVSGCAILEGPTPATPERTTPPPPETAPELVADGTASDNLPYFREVLRSFSSGDAEVQGRPVADALTHAGFDPAAMQVSFDESKTGLAADNIFVSVRFGQDCLIGQVVAEDRSFAAEVEPAVGPDQDICLIGETRAIGTL